MDNYTNNRSVDKEYSCQWGLEKSFLDKKGIRYNFVKTIDGVTTYKYIKNCKLFYALAEFYEDVYSK